MLVIGFKNGKTKGINLKKHFTDKKIEFIFDTPENDDEIKKIVNFDEGKIMIASEKKGIKLFNVYNNTTKIFLKNPFPNLRDFDLHSKTHVFVAFDKTILSWKKVSPFKWKKFARINVIDSIDRLLVSNNSNLMLTTSYYQNKSNLWSFSNGKISFCGKFFLMEKIASLVNSEKNNHFAMGSISGKIYVFTNLGVLVNRISPPNIFRNKIFSSDPFPLEFFDNNILFSGGGDKQLCRWDIRIPKIISYWQGHIGKICQIDCYPCLGINNSFSVVSSDDLGIVKIWDIRTGKEFSSIKIFPKKITSLKIN